MKYAFLFSFLFLTIISRGQSKIDWDKDYELQLSDFRASSTQIGEGNNTLLQNSAGFGFLLSMSNAEFMFIKNFNSKVTCSFNREAASLVAPDSATAFDLLAFSRYQFDLAELYARKFRKELYEKKGAFSDSNFFNPIFDENQREFSNRSTMAGNQTDLGRNKDKLQELHQEVLAEIEAFADFCKMCKPPKKKK